MKKSLKQNKTFNTIGSILRTHGVYGEVVVRIAPGKLNYFKEKKFVFVEIQQEQIPFCIEQIRPFKQDLLLLLFNDISSLEDAEKMVPSNLYVKAAETATMYDAENIINYEVFNSNVCVGVIKDYVNTGKQTLLIVITTDNKEVLIPFVEDFIIKIDMQKKQCLLNLPEGLVDINRI